MASALAQILANAERGVAERGRFDYTEGPRRMAFVHRPWPAPPVRITCDCSAAVTYWFAWAGAPDPNGLNYDGYGFTGTLLSHDQHVAAISRLNRRILRERVRPGDLVIYGPGSGWHVGIVVEVSPLGDALTISHGRQGDPSRVWADAPSAGSPPYPVDGRQPQTFVRPSHRRISPLRRAIRRRLPAIPLGYQRP